MKNLQSKSHSFTKTIPLYTISKHKEISTGLFKIYQLKGSQSTNSSLGCVPFQTNVPHRHSFYEVCIFMEGTGNHEIDFMNYPIKPGGIHFIFPGQVHQITDQSNIKGYVMAFDRDFYAMAYNATLLIELSHYAQNKAVLVLDLSYEGFGEFLDLVELIKVEFTRNRLISWEVIGSFLHIFLMKSKYYSGNRFLEPPIYQQDQNIIARFYQNLENNFCQKHLVKDYADDLELSVNYLNKIAKGASGKTAGDLINDRVILEAKRHLTFSRMNHKQIAYALGFEDPSYFSRFFRKKTGFSPTQFKKKVREKLSS